MERCVLTTKSISVNSVKLHFNVHSFYFLFSLNTRQAMKENTTLDPYQYFKLRSIYCCSKLHQNSWFCKLHIVYSSLKPEHSVSFTRQMFSMSIMVGMLLSFAWQNIKGAHPCTLMEHQVWALILLDPKRRRLQRLVTYASIFLRILQNVSNLQSDSS